MIIVAKFPGKCAGCNEKFSAGCKIAYDGRPWHEECVGKTPPPALVANPRRPAFGAIEEAAAKGIVAIAQDDPDRARVVNGVGFSKFDHDFGHKMAEEIEAAKGLTDKQWTAVVKLAKKYRRQLAETPVADCNGDAQHGGRYTWWEYDAQNIPLAKVCDRCVNSVLSKYRPCILTGYTQADVDEPIEPED